MDEEITNISAHSQQYSERSYLRTLKSQQARQRISAVLVYGGSDAVCRLLVLNSSQSRKTILWETVLNIQIILQKRFDQLSL